MKKLLALALAMMMVLSLAACGDSGSGNTGNPNSDPGTQESTPAGGESQEPSGGDTTGGTDLSAYPADLNDWTGQNFIDYFTAAGVFTEGNGRETWLQDHVDYWPETPVSECAGYWDDDGLILIMIFTFDGSLPDTTPEAASEMKNYIKENQALPEDYMGMPIDHLVGDVAFCYMLTTDDDVYNAMDAAYNDLVSAMGVTPDF